MEKFNKKLFVISHTHWDREWYMPLELMKLRLVDMIDHCLVILQNQLEYIFHLDAQTVVLEDYLQVRPENDTLIKRFVSEHRLIIGPWYLQNDFYLTSGEATIRNLLEGTRMAESFGGSDTVGYAPDQFGNISQMPQILKNFGIDNFVFGRGVAKTQTDEHGNVTPAKHPSEFIWEGADGTRALAIHMTMWYNNAQRFSSDIDKAVRLAESIEKGFSDIAATPYLLLMNGVDHLEAQDNLLDILAQINSKWSQDHRIWQYSLRDYIDKVKQYINETQMPLYVHHGEMRNGHDMSILKGTLSSRSYLKIANVRAQNCLEQQMEPLYSMMEIAGMSGIYSRDHLRFMWKKLLRNHPHDSICGCSCDEVHQRMEESYASLSRTAGEWMRRGLTAINEHVQLSDRRSEETVITVVNTTERIRSGVVRCSLDFLITEEIQNFELLDPDDQSIPFIILSHDVVERDVFSPVNLPGHLTVDRYVIEFYESGAAPFSVKGYRVRKAKGILPVHECSWLENTDVTFLENEHLKVMVYPNGRVDVFNKEDHQLIENVLEWEESADAGDSYVYGRTATPVILGREFPAHVFSMDKPDVHQCLIQQELMVPQSYLFDESRRSDNKVGCPVQLLLTLEKSSKTLHVQYQVENQACDHRIRIMIHTGIVCMSSIADIPFDVIVRDADDHYYNTMSQVNPNTSFTLLEQNGKGLAVLTEGQHEYEHLADLHTLAFTIIRSTGVITRNMSNGKVDGGAQWLCPENQCLRTITGNIGIYPYCGDWITAEVPFAAKAFRTPLLCISAPVNKKKFMGGRPAVQDTTIQEFFYQDDPWEAVNIPNNKSVLTVEGEGIQVTALKSAEDGKGMILRLVNLTEDQRVASVTLFGGGAVWETNMREKESILLGKDHVSVNMKKKEIKTLRLTM